MAKPSPPTLKPKTTSFLICFRYSKNKTIRSHDDDDDKKKLKISTKTSTTRSSWLCCSAAAGFRLKKAAATKTVPLDMISTVSPQPNNSYRSSSSVKLVDDPEPETKSKHVKFQVPAVTDIVEDPGVPIQRRLIVSDVITPAAANSKRKPPQTVSDTINLENRTRQQQQQQQLDSDVNACQKRRLSFCRKVDSIRTTAAANGSQPGSPVQLQPRTVGAAPPPKRTRRGGTVGASLAPRKTWLVSNERMNMMTSSSMRRPRKRLDPLVGMTIIMVTLIIMILWGRLCAILCTAAWLYLLPRLSTTHDQINGNLTTSAAIATSSTTSSSFTAGNIFPHPRDDYYLDLMMSSDEYKKKVVLEGFLERNNHRTG